MNKPSNFDVAYKGLNPKQRQAVDHIDGPMLVLAGPGTGKTQILATRVAHILRQTDTPPESILALTFTDAGVRAMRERLLKLIGAAAYQVGIYTFHSFCAEVIRRYPEQFIIGPDPQPLSDLERFSILQQILDNNSFRLLRPVNAPYYYLRAIIDAIQNLKREGIQPPDLRKLVSKTVEEFEDLKTRQKEGEKIAKTKLADLEKQADKQTDLVEIYYLYQKAILDRGRFDYEDMINFVVRELDQNETLRLSLQENYHYFLVDEFQDTNSAQLLLLGLLSSYWGPKANVFVVGDPNQSIYRFQGASFENVLAFLGEFPGAKVVSLVDNYRSTKTILDSAYQLIGSNQELKLKKHSSQLKLVSHSKLTETPISLTRFSNGLVEQYHLGLQVKSLIDKGTDPGEIAVIYKRNQTALELIPILNYFKIPYQIAGGGNVLADDQIRLLVRLLKLIAAVSTQEEDGVASFEFLTLPFFDLNPVDIIRVSREAAKRRRPILDQLGDKQLKALELRDPEQLQKIRDRLFSWSAQANQMPLSEFVQLLVFESGFLGHLEKRPDSFEKLTHLKALLDFVSGLQQSIPDLALPGLVEQLEILDQNGLGIDEPDLGLQPGLVTLTTAHKTKGLEWDHCFLYRLVDGEWGNPRTRELIKLPEGILQFAPRTQDRKQQNEDERRLFYVCLTRAKKQLYLSYSAIYPQGGSRENAPSLFLSELPTSLIEEKKVDTAIEDVMAALKSLVSPTPPRVGQDERKYLKTLINDELQLSASAITTYQQCGYKFKLRYLLKIPEAQSPILIFGSAVHRSLELFFAQLKRTQTVPPLETLLELFVSVIERQPLAESELGHRREKGVQILTAYYQQHQEEFPEPLFVERWFGGRGASILWKNIPLVGKIDRVDLIDARSKSVRVVDYKTGRPKSLNHILGKTAEADQSQLTQLLFYKLITELDPSFNYQVSELVLDFVEGPHQHKNFKRPQISATKEQIEELKQTIESTYRDIKQLKFDRTTNLRTCHDCPFKHHCWPDGLPRIDPEQLSLLEAN